MENGLGGVDHGVDHAAWKPGRGVFVKGHVDADMTGRTVRKSDFGSDRAEEEVGAANSLSEFSVFKTGDGAGEKRFVHVEEALDIGDLNCTG